MVLCIIAERYPTMSRLPCLTALTLLPVMFTLGVNPMTGHLVEPAHASQDSARCELRVSKRGGGTTLEGVVIASKAVSGSYRISVAASSGAGSSDIDQSGEFSASPGQPVSLGVVQIGSGGYAANLTIKWAGGSTSCSGKG